MKNFKLHVMTASGALEQHPNQNKLSSNNLSVLFVPVFCANAAV